jgi:hypothetical protein
MHQNSGPLSLGKLGGTLLVPTVALDCDQTVRYTRVLRYTQYFVNIRRRPDRQAIRDEWIDQVIARPEAESTQADGRVRLWARIPEAGGRYLRVVLLDDRQTVHNVFFDRSFRGTK